MRRLEALDREDWTAFLRNTNPRCPHCGQYSEVWSNGEYEVMSDGEHEFECYHCDKPFLVTTIVDISFSTYAQPGGK